MDQRTQQEFLNIMLRNLSNTEDKTPNSFSYDILSAVSIVFEEGQRIINSLFQKFDVDNLEDDELEKRVLQISGLQRKLPTQSKGQVTLTGTPGTIIPSNTLFLAGNVEFSIDREYVIPDSGNLNIDVVSVAYGRNTNVIPGSITQSKPSTQGITNITNLNEILNGYDAESDEDLRERYYEKLLNPPKGGNPAHYKLWATEVDGIWNAKVFRTWNGGGTVKVVVIGLDRKKVSDELIDKVKAHILEEAPIRYESLTVESATTKKINVTVSIKLSQNASEINTKTIIKNRIEKYLYDISFNQNFVSYAKIGGEILDSIGVADYSDLLLSGASKNITLEETEVPELGKLEVNIIE